VEDDVPKTGVGLSMSGLLVSSVAAAALLLKKRNK
jgi:LPXTG-motif cell wall-anchored protein